MANAPPKVAIQGQTPERLIAKLPLIPIEDARKLVAAVFRDDALTVPPRNVRSASLRALLAGGHVPTLTVLSEQRSELDPFRKFVLQTADGHAIETVRIPLERAGRFSACVSSQVGCALACAFCATGRMGLKRNLEAWEIVEQVRVLRRSLDQPGQRIHGVVFQGMGEPLSNLDRVLEAISVMSDPCALAIDRKAITVCTAGLPSGIRRLAREAPNVRLALSISSARAQVRRSLMPIDQAHPLEEVLDAAVEHTNITGRAPMWALTPLAGVNDSAEDARALGECVRRFQERTGKRPRVSIVPYNRIDDDVGDPFRRAEARESAAFRAALIAEGVVPHLRYSGGGDVGAACGQLAGAVT